jgi:hypothetical protein
MTRDSPALNEPAGRNICTTLRMIRTTQRAEVNFHDLRIRTSPTCLKNGARIWNCVESEVDENGVVSGEGFIIIILAREAGAWERNREGNPITISYK